LSDIRPAPYPAKTKAKGWRFEIDYEKVDQSDTWSLASEIPMAQPALLMMWLMAWTMEPVGSMPNDQNIIRAKCKIPPAVWLKVGPILMRGWWLADDGRLYHDTIVQRVLEMLEYRQKEADRRARNRGSPADVPDLSRGTDAGQPPDSHGMPDTGTGTSSSLRSEGKPARKRAAPSPDCPDGVEAQTWSDFLDLRRKKSAPVTRTVLAGAGREAVKAGITLQAFLELWCLRGSQGLMAEWLKPHEIAAYRGAPAAPPSNTVLETGLRAVAATQQYLAGQTMTPEAEARAAAARAEFLAKHKGAKAPEPEGQPQ
jgi:hypothetical protein